MLDRVSSIMKKIGILDNCKDLKKMPISRRNNKIKSIYSSNYLPLNQVKDIIDDKIVLGRKKRKKVFIL